MRKLSLYLYLIALVMATAACSGEKKRPITGDDVVDVADFIGLYPPSSIPYAFGDTVLLARRPDSSRISYKVISQFIPDSILAKVAGKNVSQAPARFYPLARVENTSKDNYLFTIAEGASGKQVFLAVFDKGNSFINAMPVLKPDQSAATQQAVSFGRNSAISLLITRKNKDESVSQGQEVYALDPSAKAFSLVMTEALDKRAPELINPIDSLPRRQKHTADYSSGKSNLVSIRDGRRGDRISFFVHFEQNNGECTGELKGEAVMINANTAEYRQGGDPCVLQFRFGSSSVTLKEIEGCGARRGLRCSFNGVYPRKKDIKSRTKK